MELTLLEEEQIIEKNRLKVFDQIGEKAAITDYAIALGVYVCDDYYIENGNHDLADRTGYYWTKTSDGSLDAHVVLWNGFRFFSHVINRFGGIRAALPYSEISFLAKNVERGSNGVTTLECGSLPKDIVPKMYGKQLEDAYFGRKTRNIFRKSSQNLEIQRIDTGYTGDARAHNEYDQTFLKEEYPSILIDHDIYTRVPIKPRFESKVKLSNGKTYQVGDMVWMKKAPVIWYYDEESGIVFTKDLISAGV